MGGVNVKNTIVEALMQNIAPHPCFGCAKIGALICDYCKYDIISEPFVGCILCGIGNLDGICQKHGSFIDKSYVVSDRTGVVKALIDGLKFQHVKAAAASAAQLLHESLPLFPANTLIVPIPTVKSHVRERGYDQVALIAGHFAKLRGLTVMPLLKRVNKATQHELSKEDRLIEAERAFALSSRASGSLPDDSTPYLILDDIITTGATVTQAAKVLADGTRPIFVAAVAYQPLE